VDDLNEGEENTRALLTFSLRLQQGTPMHVPDGFISPKVYLPAYAAAAGLWLYGLRRVMERLDEETIPTLAVLTALAFVLMMVTVPLPGGTSVHAAGVGILAVMFGIWISFMAVSIVLLLQVALFGAGGVTSLPINALAMGLAGAAAAWYLFRWTRRVHEKSALFLAGWISLVLPAFLIAVTLGLQPVIAHTDEGVPLFFPFGLSITLPAVLIPHVLIGIGEGLLTVLVFRLFSRFDSRSKP
jgi:cobalt/nickel transport system permease protein